MQPLLIRYILVNCLAALMLPIGAQAALNLATEPLSGRTSEAAKPNIMFILDDSASMLYTYMPEWAGKAAICGGEACTSADPVFRSSDFNTLYYNPKFRYFPAKFANGDDWPSITSYTRVKDDAYDVIKGTTNLTSAGVASYTIMTPGEYCTDVHLTNCVVQSNPSTSHPYPAYVRFCNGLSRATSAASPPDNTCQATVAGNFRAAFARYPSRNGTVPGSLQQVNIVSTNNSYPKAKQRTDCPGSSCTYNQEMTNYANWWTYYQTRIQTMKTSTSLAFANIDDNFRVGYNVINNDSLNETHHSAPVTKPNKFLNIRAFDVTQKEAFYDRLFAGRPSLKQSWQDDVYTDKYYRTPLRASLSHVGRYFAKKLDGQTFDPIQNACQANFAILSTDGSWNTEDEIGKFGSYGLGVDGRGNPIAVGNMDAGLTVPLPKREGAVFENSLADVAKYYADTDLRSAALGNCAGADGDLCGSEATKQNMTTFTVGLGINGTLIYQDDYKTALSGDFYNLKQGILKWPTGCPSDYCPERVDDLWHAAVNGDGSYFSAQNPKQLQESLTAALDEIYARANAGGAAATSTLSPVLGNNTAYVGSYTSMKWTGNLEARSIDTVTGNTSKTADWCVESIEAEVCLTPNIQTTKPNDNNAKRVYCAPSGTSLFTADMEIAGGCTGQFPTNNGVPRRIYTNVANTLKEFVYSNLSESQKTNFKSPFLSANLSQWNSLSVIDQSNATESNLVNYLRSPFNPVNNAFRNRLTTLGDITESAAVYVAAPNFNYLDASYGEFKRAQAGRTKSVYVGANDGMLHAFNAIDGTERWAYIPSILIPKLWHLADKNYSTRHKNFVNGSTTVSDVCFAPCNSVSNWKTILVGGLNEGGKAYYALDITNDQPLLLWEFDTNDDPDMGFSFGNPVITKQSDGTWVVLLTSGYNNTGAGYLYVVNPNTGAIIRKISTRVGTSTEPSGLSKISAFVARPSENNQADFVYGGDLLGNLWRFKIDSVNSDTNPFLLATLKDPSGIAQAITARPELGKISGQTVVFIGTGKYLEESDLPPIPSPSSTTTKPRLQTQTLYAIKDGSRLISRANLEPRSMTASGTTRTATRGDLAFTSGNGWYIDLLDNGERQVVPAKLASGTLVVPTMVPSSTTCSAGGYGWLNYINAKTGGIVANPGNTLISTMTSSSPVGINILYIAGTPKLSYTGGQSPTPKIDPNAPFNSGSVFSGKRASWRELIR
jgi:type IV pilus assembly protein PilY1